MPNIGLIDQVTRYALDHGYHVVLDGILDAGHYEPMLAGYSSSEKRSQADCRVMPSASPILVQVMPRARAVLTVMVSCRSS